MTERAVEIAERALAHAGGEGDAIVQLERSGFARYAGSEVHQPTLVEDAVVELRLVEGSREGIASTNRISDEGLADLARRAREALASSGEREEPLGPAEPAAFPAVAGWDERTAELGADELAALAGAAIAGSALPVYGYATVGACELALASTAGARGSQRFTDATCVTLAADAEASGYAAATSWRVGDVDAAAVAAEASAKADRTRGAAVLEPAKVRAVLEPYAIGELLLYFAYDSFNALGLLEERSFFTGRLGTQVFDRRVGIVEDALDPRGLPKAFDFEGVPKQRVALVEEGVARDVVWDRATAARAGRTSTGHGMRPAERAWGPLPFALSLEPGEVESTAELAELVGDGIYVTRLHYLGVVDPREGVLTGMTRDGTFRIRDGKVAEPLVNLRFTVAMPELLADVPGLTRTRALVNQSDFYDARYPFAYLVPAIATGAFNVTGTGSGPGL